MASSSDALLSQELFDETVIENEECFDLSPDDALRETIDQFCQQLGVARGSGSNDATEQCDGAQSPTSVAASSSAAPASAAAAAGEEISSSSEAAAAAGVDNINIPAALSHLVISHPNSPDGKQIRADRNNFQKSLNLLDGCVNTDGTVTVNADASTKVLESLAEIGRRCRFGDGSNGGEKKGNDNNSKSPTKAGSALPYLAIFQRTSSIYTLMSFLSVIDPTGSDNNDDSKLRMLSTTVRNLSSILTNNPTKDDGKCIQLRAELRDSFVPALGRLVCLIAGIVKSIAIASEQSSASSSSSMAMEVLCELLQLATNATRGCEGAKVAFVQSALPSELNTVANSTTKRGGVIVIISCLSLPTTRTSNNNAQQLLLTEACQLLASLCRYDDFRDPSASNAGGAMAGVNTSSAHDHAMEFHRAGAPTLLVKVARDVLSKLSDAAAKAEDELVASRDGTAAGEELLAAAVLTALRVLAVNDDIIQTMVALGVLPIVTEALKLAVAAEEKSGIASQSRRQRLAASSLGLLRNLCGNDEIKTNLCLGSSSFVASSSDQSSSTASILPHLLRSMQLYPTTAIIQEHACGTLAAMALRRPANARAILNADGPRWMLSAMKRHEDNVNVQRQGALAVRNVVSRLLRDLPDGSGAADSSSAETSKEEDERSSIRDAFLELGAENTLRSIAGRHQGSVDEAYAALRDLGCTVSLVKFDVSEDGKATTSAKTVGGVGRTMMFGEKHNSNFRAVYEESAGLSEGVDDAISSR